MDEIEPPIEIWDLLNIQTLHKGSRGRDAWQVVVDAYARPSCNLHSCDARLDQKMARLQQEQEIKRRERLLFLEDDTPWPGREHIKRGLPDWF